MLVQRAHSFCVRNSTSAFVMHIVVAVDQDVMVLQLRIKFCSQCSQHAKGFLRPGIPDPPPRPLPVKADPRCCACHAATCPTCQCARQRQHQCVHHDGAQIDLVCAGWEDDFVRVVALQGGCPWSTIQPHLHVGDHVLRARMCVLSSLYLRRRVDAP